MISTLFDRTLRGLAVFSAGILGVIAVFIAINVVLRNLGLPVVYGALDAIQYALMIGGHVKVDLITSNLSQRTAYALTRLTSAIGAVTAGVLGWYGLQAVLASAARGSMIRTSFVIPEWWMLAFVPLSLALCTIIFIRRLLYPETAERSLSGL